MMEEYINRLIKNKIIDTKIYFSSTYFKLESAKLNLRTIIRIIDNIKIEHEQELNENIALAINTNSMIIIDTQINDLMPKVDFCGEKIDFDIILNKLFFETISLLHSFFDNYAQWINASVFGDEALVECKVSIKRICEKINKDASLKQDLPFITNITNNENFKLVDTLNNIIKHRYQIFTNNKFGLVNGVVNQTIELFDFDTKKNSKYNCLKILENCIKYCEGLFDDYYKFSFEFLEDPSKEFKLSIKNKVNYMISDNEIIIDSINLGDTLLVLPLNNYIFVEPPFEIKYKSLFPDIKLGLLRKIDTSTFNKDIPKYYKYEVIT